MGEGTLTACGRSKKNVANLIPDRVLATSLDM